MPFPRPSPGAKTPKKAARSAFPLLLSTFAFALSTLLAVPSARAYEWQNSAIWESSLAERGFTSGPSWFSAGPAWMMNAMPGSNFRARNYVINSAGDLEESTTQYNGYVGTLHDVFDVNLFSNVSLFATTSTISKAPTPRIMDLTSPSIWNGGGTNNLWTNSSNWNGNVPIPGTAYDLQFAGTTNLSTNNDFTSASDFGSITFNSGAGAFTLAGNSITLNSDITNSSTNLQTITLNIATTAVRTFTMTAGGGDITIGVSGDTTKGIISGGGGLTVAGAGTLTLWGNNTYTGATTVSGGTVLVNGSIAAGTGVTVSNAGTVLGGTGTINENVAVGASSAILGGTGAAASGTLTVNNGSLTLASNSIIELALGTGGTHSTLAHTGTGAISFATNQDFKFIDLGATPGAYTGLITGVTDPGTALTTWVIDNPGYTGVFTWDPANGGEIDLALSAIPEPSTWIGAALALGVIGVMGRKRFSKKLKA